MPAEPIRLRDMSPAEFDAYSDRQEREYVEAVSHVMGIDAAQRKARNDRERVLPDGLATEGHRLLVVENKDGEIVGQAWIAMSESQTNSSDVAWLYDVRIEERFRRHGYGRAVMKALESVAREAGATRLGLNVFGHNVIAISLYESCGYSVTAQQMAKDLR